MREETEELMLLYVAGVADDAQVAQAEELLASADPTAQARYAEAMAVVHSIPQALPQKSPPPAVRDQLMLRVLASGHSGDPAQPMRATSRRPTTNWPAWIAGSVAAVLAVGVLALWQQNSDARMKLAMQMEESSRTNEIAGSPHVHFVKLNAGPSHDEINDPTGRLMYCPVTNQYELRVFHLRPPPPGKVYELWLITKDEQKIPSGTFTTDALGNAVHYYEAPKGVDFSIAAITDEPEGGSSEPTGQIRLSGPLATH